MSIKSYLSNFLLDRRINSSEKTATKKYLFEKKLEEILIILPAHHSNTDQKRKLEHIGKPLFSNIDFLTVSDVDSAKTELKSDLSVNDLNYKGRFRKNDFILPLKSNYDLVINLLQENEATIELFISLISSSLKIRFDRVNEKFYNFIVPIENKDIFQRFEQFLKVYQTLKK